MLESPESMLAETGEAALPHSARETLRQLEPLISPVLDPFVEGIREPFDQAGTPSPTTHRDL